MLYSVDSTRVVYTADPGTRRPGAFLAALWRDIRRSRELAWRLFTRDLSAQYRQSILGAFWTFVAPLTTSLIFIVLHSRRVVDFGPIDVPYPVYVVVGTILWQSFVESLNAPLKAVTAAKPMLAKINFPREALVTSAWFMVLYGLCVKLTVMAGLLLVFGIRPNTGWLLAAGPMVMLVLLGFAVGLLLTPVGMLYSDVGTGLPVAAQLLFFVTPVVYAPPQSFPFSLVATMNPASPLLIGARELITKGRVTSWEGVAVMALVAAGGMLAGLVVYRVALPIIIERTGA